MAKLLKPVLLLSIMTVSQLPAVSHAAPQVVVTDPTTGQPLANQPMSASGVLPASQVIPTQNPNQPTLAQLNQPSDSQLSQANTELLAKNAELQRRVDSLTSQNNVLVNERSGDLFVKGAYTAGFSLLLGFGLGWLLFGRNKRW